MLTKNPEGKKRTIILDSSLLFDNSPPDLARTEYFSRKYIKEIHLRNYNIFETIAYNTFEKIFGTSAGQSGVLYFKVYAFNGASDSNLNKYYKADKKPGYSQAALPFTVDLRERGSKLYAENMKRLYSALMTKRGVVLGYSKDFTRTKDFACEFNRLGTWMFKDTYAQNSIDKSINGMLSSFFSKSDVPITVYERRGIYQLGAQYSDIQSYFDAYFRYGNKAELLEKDYSIDFKNLNDKIQKVDEDFLDQNWANGDKFKDNWKKTWNKFYNKYVLTGDYNDEALEMFKGLFVNGVDDDGVYSIRPILTDDFLPLSKLLGEDDD